MKIRDIITSRNIKLAFFVLCIGMMKFRNVFAYPPWFQQNLTAKDVAANLNYYPAQIDEINQDGFTGLMYAVRAGYKEIVRLFMKHGASLDMTAKNTVTSKDNERFYESTALHMALLNSDDNDSFEIAKDLIHGVKKDDGSMTQKANVLVKNGFGFTPLHTVESSVENPERRFELIEILMSAAGNTEVQEGFLNAQNDDGDTILHIMAQKNDMGLIEKIILKYGRMLKLQEKNKQGKTPADISRESGNGLGCANRLDVEAVRYKDLSLSDEEYKSKPRFTEIPSTL